MKLRYAPGLFAAALALPTLAVTVTVHPVYPHCGYANGSITAAALGGVPPYAYVWNTAATGTTISNLPPGTYTVTVSDGLGNTDDETITLTDIPDLGMIDMVQALPACDGACTGILWFSTLQVVGVAPFTYDWPFPDVQGNMVFLHGFCPEQPASVTVTDANGCTGTLQGMVSDSPPGYFESVTASPACADEDNGRIIITDPVALQEGGYVQLLNVTSGAQFYYATGADPLEIDSLAPGNYQVTIVQPDYSPVYCFAGATVEVPVVPGPCGTLSGEAYYDFDQDCTHDATDVPMAYRVLTVEPGSSYAITQADGSYALPLPFGAYTLDQPLTDLVQLCPASSPVPFTLDAVTPATTIDLADSSTIAHDLAVHLNVTDLRPGFPFHIWGGVNNISVYPSGSVTLTLTYDPVLGSLSAFPSPSSTMPGQLTWDIPVIDGMQAVQLDVHGIVPADITLLGTVVTTTLSAANTLTESDPLNNSMTVENTIEGSYDPNAKQARTDGGHTDGYFLDSDHEVTYAVHFQNTGTAPAQTVVVRDTLESDLDITSLRILGASHAFVPSIAEGRVLTFTFANIQLPDSGSDQGYVSFALRPVEGIVVGDELTNTADIYFDLNPPVITNTAVLPVELATNVADVLPAPLRLFPNPASSSLTVVLPHTSTVPVIWAADGRKVVVPVTRTDNTVVFDVGALAPGLYMVRTENGATRFVKH